MSSARERILRRVRSGLKQDGPRSLDEAHAARQHGYGAGLSPRQPWSGDPVARFCERHENWAGTWQKLDAAERVPNAVKELCGTDDRLAVADHPLLQGLEWPAAQRIANDQAANASLTVSVADAAIAETGTLVFCSGPTSPTGLAILPETHVVVLQAADILDDMEAVWQHLQQRSDFPPRSLNTISGPSRTADVEQTIQLGAHGPRRVHVLLLGKL